MTKDFPLGHATSFVCWRMVVGTMLTVLLLPISIASAGYAYSVYTIAQIPAVTDVESLSNKSVSYWFVALALFSISSWTVIVRWLLSQLMEQRKANTEATTQLINYMKEDHTSTKVLLERVSGVLDKIAQKAL